MIVVLLSTLVFRNFNHTNEKGQHLIQKVEVISNHLIQRLQKVSIITFSAVISLRTTLVEALKAKLTFRGVSWSCLMG